MKQRKANRMAGYDYSKESLYFVTSCVKNMFCCLGEIIEGEMIHNDYGLVAQYQWEWLENHFPFVVSHAFTVMPNHVHGVPEIARSPVGTARELSVSLNEISSNVDEVLPQKIKNLSGLMGAYKTTVSEKIHFLGFDDFKWQRSFHDHIIRNSEEYEKIVRYIETNPQRWASDKFYKQ